MADRRRKARELQASNPNNKSEGVEFNNYKFERGEEQLPSSGSNMDYSHNDVLPEEKEFINIVRNSYPQFSEKDILFHMRETHELGALRHVYNKSEIKKLPKSQGDLNSEYSKEENIIRDLQKHYGIEDPTQKKNISNSSSNDPKLIIEIIF